MPKPRDITTRARSPRTSARSPEIAGGGDAIAAVVALDVLTRLDPPDHQAIANLAATGHLADVRHRAFAIAERDGFAASIDRAASWTLDLKQTSSCDERKDLIAK